MLFQYSLCGANELQVNVQAGEKYLEVWNDSSGFQPIYVNGVNLSGVLPGRHATEPCTVQATYTHWFGLLREMNANAIRVFNTMPPQFYAALAQHNADHPGNELWLIQGIWAELPHDGDFSDEEYTGQNLENIHRAVAAVNGSDGSADVSAWLLSYLFGREWEAPSVIKFNEMHPELTSFEGAFVSANQASPMECWLAEMCDAIVDYETATYNWQHPVSFINWVATDPIDHRQAYKDELGADFEIPAEAQEDFLVNDAVSLSINNLQTADAFKAGLYASYHVYPYYPDFIARQPQYASVSDSRGTNSFLGYLQNLKSHYQNTPLLITEYGLASSTFAVHQHPQGWNHGGMSEAHVAKVLPRLTNAIASAGCGGGAVFAWTDGWFKRVWLWNRLYNPADEARLWFNQLDPEQNYGLLALEPTGGTTRFGKGSTGWEGATLLTQNAVVSSNTQTQVWAMHDEGFFYLRVKVPNNSGWQFKTGSLHIGLNVEGDGRGNHAFPYPVQHQSPQAMELMLVVSNGTARLYQASTFRYWSALKRVDADGASTSDSYSVETNPFGWILPQAQTNSPVLSTTGQVTLAQAWPLNPLKQGSFSPGEDFDPHAAWNFNADTGTLELRIPWMLAGFCAPHSRRVLAIEADGTVGNRVSDGIGVELVLSNSSGIIETVSPTSKYMWDEWWDADITYSERRKPAYFSLKDTFSHFGPL